MTTDKLLTHRGFIEGGPKLHLIAKQLHSLSHDDIIITYMYEAQQVCDMCRRYVLVVAVRSAVPATGGSRSAAVQSTPQPVPGHQLLSGTTD
jgi:hypothetical protein